MSRKIRVALIGVGNSGCIFLQGLQGYEEGHAPSWLWHKRVGGYEVSDIEVVEGFDVDKRKIGLDLCEAVFQYPNVASRYFSLRETGVKVKLGLSRGSTPSYMERWVAEGEGEVAKILAESRVDVAVNLLPSGLDDTSKAYAEAALKAGCSFVNCTITSIADSLELAERFRRASLVVVGDDLMSQFGGTVFYKGLLSFIHSRGVNIRRCYQLDVGGGAESLNAMDERVRWAKRDVKTNAVSVELPYSFEGVAGTTDYVEHLGNERVSYFWIEGEGFLGSPVQIDIYLRTSDGPNAGNILLDVVRAVQTAREKGEFGAQQVICSYGFKRAPRMVTVQEALKAFEDRYVDSNPTRPAQF